MNVVSQFIRFGIVGGTGVIVNFALLWLQRKLLPLIWASAAGDDNIVVGIGSSEYNIRWYMVFVAVSFLGSNLFNYQLNRWWSFRSSRHAPWWLEYLPFLIVGLINLGIGSLVVLALMHTGSPIALPRDILDGSTGFKTPIYWANLIMIMVTTPLSFVLNKFWTFRSVLERAQ